MLKYCLPLTLLVCIYLLSALESCTKDKTLVTTTPCDSMSVTYINDISPILLNNQCVACHGSSKPKLESYEQVVDAAKNGNLLCSINWTGCRKMPEGGNKLPDSVLKKFDIWKCKNYPN